MKKTLFAIAAALSMSMVWATSTHDTNNYGDTNYNTTNAGGNATQGQVSMVDVNTNITNDVRTNAAAFADANVNTGDVTTKVTTGDVTTSYNSGGNTQQVTVTDSGQMQYSGNYTVKTVPNVVASDIYPTSPCMGSSSVGGSGVGFGFSIGSSWTDDECGIRETARSFSGMNLKDDALAILCSSKYATAAPSCKKDK